MCVMQNLYRNYACNFILLRCLDYIVALIYENTSSCVCILVQACMFLPPHLFEGDSLCVAGRKNMMCLDSWINVPKSPFQRL